MDLPLFAGVRAISRKYAVVPRTGTMIYCKSIGCQRSAGLWRDAAAKRYSGPCPHQPLLPCGAVIVGSNRIHNPRGNGNGLPVSDRLQGLAGCG